MTVADWLTHAIQDARARGLPQLEPLLASLAKSTDALRAADDAARRREIDEIGEIGGIQEIGGRADAPPPEQTDAGR